MKKGTRQRRCPYFERVLLYLFFALTFVHLARCAAAIRSRAAADNLRRPPPPRDPPTPFNAAIARSSLSRSFFNCATTAPRSVICWPSIGEDLTANRNMISNGLPKGV